MAAFDETEWYTERDDFHAIETIQLGELVNDGLFEWETDDSLIWDYYSEEQYKRVMGKFVNRYFYREIGVVPYKKWRLFYVRKMNEIMPKYKILYAALDSGTDPLQDSRVKGDKWGKSRNVFSDFPATQLGDNQDYADNSTDRQYEDMEDTVTQGSYLDKALQLQELYNDIDVMILDDCNVLFSSLYSMSMNGL